MRRLSLACLATLLGTVAGPAESYNFSLMKLSTDNELVDTGVFTDAHYRADTFGVSAGFPMSPTTRLDVYFLSGDTSVEYDQLPEELDSESVIGAVRFAFEHQGLLYEQWISYADSDYTSKQYSEDPLTHKITLDNVGLYDGRHIVLAGILARELVYPGFTFEPSIGYLYSHYRQDGYVEGGTGGRSFDDRSASNKRFDFALSIAKPLIVTDTHWLTFTAAVRLSHEFSDYAPNGSLSRVLPIAGNAFLIDSSPAADDHIPDQSSRIFEAGLSYIYTENFRLNFGYAKVDNDNLDTEAWAVEATYLFGE